MYVHMITLGKGFATRQSGPNGPLLTHLVEITNDTGDSVTVSGSAEHILSLCEQFNQIQQEILRQREETRCPEAAPLASNPGPVGSA
jgi:hypothetical protein